MKELRRFVCWDKARVSKTILTEADAPSNAVFLATHVRTPIYRRSVGAQVRGTEITEEQVLADLEALPVDMPILPILGESGTGKSHLVRWLRAHLSDTPTRRVLWIPKFRTSLRGVIDRILEGADGPEFEEIKAAVETATEDLTEREARLRLLASLSTRVELFGSGPLDNDDYEERAYIAERLPALLNDPEFKDTLLKTGGPIGRIVREKLEGRGIDDKDEPFAFQLADLPLRPTDPGRAGAVVKKFLGRLVTDERMQELTVAMLNEQLDTGISEVFGVSRGQLRNAMLSLRRLYLSRGQELVLLIEDLFMMQGIQGELLEAIIEAPIRDEQDLCTMRVAVAVTTGHFRKLYDTVRTRTLNEYILDVKLDEIGDGAIYSFVAAYLNAARLGRDRLDKEFSGRQGSEDWIPNACDECPAGQVARRLCHAGFGNQDNRGLYPFNRPALQRLVRSQAPGHGFLPRAILTQVLRPTLDGYIESIHEGDFPNSDFADQFKDLDAENIDAALEREVLRRDPQNGPRRTVLLNYWGGAPKQLMNLQEGIHVAFDLPVLADVSPPPKPVDGEPPPPSPTPKDERPAMVLAIDDWGRTGAVPSQRQYNDLRQLVHRAVTERLTFENGLWRALVWTVRPPGDRGWGRPILFRHERVLLAAETRPSDEPTLVLDHSSLDDVVALQALAWFDNRGDWRFPRGAELQRLLSRRLDSWTSAVKRQLLPVEVGGEGPGQVPALVKGLLFGARILGLSDSQSADATPLLHALLDAGPAIPSPPPGADAWLRLRHFVAMGSARAASREELRTQLLRLTAYSQDGQPQAINVGLLLPLIADMAADWALPSADPAIPAPVREHIAGIATLITTAMDERYEQLRSWLSSIEPLASTKTDFSEVAKGLEVTLQDAAPLGLLPSGVKYEQFASDGRGLVELQPWALVEGVRKDLGHWEKLSNGDRLARLASERQGLGEVRSYLQRADLALAGIARTIQDAMKDPEGGAINATQADAAIGRLMQQLADLAGDGKRA
jgi:hypothetical protein